MSLFSSSCPSSSYVNPRILLYITYLSLFSSSLQETEEAGKGREKMEEKRLITESLLGSYNQKGGLKTMPFIIVNEAFEKVGSYGVSQNMILYLMNEYNIGLSMGSRIILSWTAATNFTPILGAFLSDSYFGRFSTIRFGSTTSLLGIILLWLTTLIPQARPAHCNQTFQTCEAPGAFQLAFLYSSFILMSIGAGGIRSSSIAFGADQLDKRDDIEKERSLERYFSWYNISTAAASLVSFTLTVYIQDHFGWKLGFAVPVAFMLIAALSFISASQFYVKMKATESLLTGLAQVIVASYRKRRLELPAENAIEMYHHRGGSNLLAPSDKLRFLNKACLITNPEQDSLCDQSASDPWFLCTVDQVEELKALIKVIPIWSTGIMVYAGQIPISLLQIKSMNRHITSHFEIPAASFNMFLIITVIIWLSVYDGVILPVASKLMRKPIYLTAKQKMGIGLLFSSMSYSVIAIVERTRRNMAIEEGFSDNPKGVVTMSALWLLPHFVLAGIGDAFNGVAQNEFYYSEFPKSMSSIAMTLLGLGMSASNLLASFIFSTVDQATKGEGRESWVSSNINKGHYDYFCWLIACLGLINFFYFLQCCKAYGPSAAEKGELYNEEEEGEANNFL